ncbi:MAG: 3-hydroxyisobutyrate dehydrogenase [Alphaproteobacteria bacterium MarineAlpha4_Bin2]|nr:MAG: 3-hydroxyisobutyrate dehydrogenase [Alphaproteobacteria bacterium MarineAlpha4_Bin2]
MAKIGFIGVGNMGGPMAQNLIKDGHDLKAFDVVGQSLSRVVNAGAGQASSPADAASGVDAVVTMLPAGQHVSDVYAGSGDILTCVDDGTLLIDSSTIDVATSRAMHEAAKNAGFDMLDAPVSGGVIGAEAGTLTFMCGGSPEVFERAKPILEVMGKNIFLAGGPGAGQAVKACNNMLLAINMIGLSEAFNLADALGLERNTLFEIVGTASGGSWALSNYCPVPELVPTTPANNDFSPGFSGAMMLKDLKLSQDAAQSLDVSSPLGAVATTLFSMYCNEGHDTDDFSGIIRMLRGNKAGY